MRLTIVIPAHNEERRIGTTLWRYLEFYDRRLPGEYELLVVLNGCVDGTERVVDAHASDHPGAVMKRVMDGRLGKGGAIFEGFRHARGEIVAYTDADGIIPPKELARAVFAVGETDAVVAGARDPGRSGSPPPMPRRAASAVFRKLARWVLGIGLRDPQCPAKVLRRDVVEALLPHLTVTGWACDLDILSGCEALGYSVREVELAWSHQGDSRLRLWTAAPQMAVSLLRLRHKWGRVGAGSPVR